MIKGIASPSVFRACLHSHAPPAACGADCRLRPPGCHVTARVWRMQLSASADQWGPFRAHNRGWNNSLPTSTSQGTLLAHHLVRRFPPYFLFRAQILSVDLVPLLPFVPGHASHEALWPFPNQTQLDPGTTVLRGPRMLENKSEQVHPRVLTISVALGSPPRQRRLFKTVQNNPEESRVLQLRSTSRLEPSRKGATHEIGHRVPSQLALEEIPGIGGQPAVNVLMPVLSG